MGNACAPVLVAMSGIPFSGKTTLARQIAERGGMRLLSVDASAVTGNIDLGCDGTRGMGWARAIAATFRQVRPLLAAGTSVVFDHANHTCRSRERCRTLARECGARFVGVWVDVAPDVAYARLLANRERSSRADVPDASFRQISEEFEPPVNEPDVIRWRPGMGIDDLMEVITKALLNGRHSEWSEESPGDAAARSAEP